MVYKGLINLCYLATSSYVVDVSAVCEAVEIFGTGGGLGAICDIFTLPVTVWNPPFKGELTLAPISTFL